MTENTVASVAGGMSSAEYNEELARVNAAIRHHLMQGNADAARLCAIERRMLVQLRDAVLRGRKHTQQ